MDEASRAASIFMGAAWIGAGLLLFAGVTWLDLYKRMVKLRARGGGSGIDNALLEQAALLTGLGIVVVVIALGLHSLSLA